MDRHMNEKLVELIEHLNASEEIKEVLHRMNCVASSYNPKMKQSVKDLLVVSSGCEEVSAIAKCYERIITANGVYPTRGTRTYLELAFPATDEETEYREFFASPRLAAATQNHFSGVFLISLEQWKGATELIKKDAFEELLKFIDRNQQHTSFVFHITPQFRDRKLLQNELNRYLNLCTLEFSLPDRNLALLYVEQQLEKAGICLSASGKKELRRLMEEIIDITPEAYHGYRTLEKFAADLQFELYANRTYKTKTDQTVSCDKEGILEDLGKDVGKEEIQAVASYITIPNREKMYPHRLGFY